MTDNVPVVAITNVTFDGRRYRPGTPFELPAPCAHALAAAGNVRTAEPAAPPAPPRPETTQKDEAKDGRGAEPPAPPASSPPPELPGGDGSPATLEDISGIGPSTAERLRAAGVADVAALAAVSDEQLEQLRIRADWRDQARASAGAR